MPYVQLNKEGKILRISARVIIDGKYVDHNNPEVTAFLRERGQDPNVIIDALAALRKSDVEMVRSIEDIILLLLKKNLIKMNELPQEVQNRISWRARNRIIIQDIYDQASARTV